MKKLTVILTLFIFSCNPTNEKDIKANSATNEVQSKNTTSDNDFSQFYIKFRQAAITNDTNTIISLTKFPLETRAPQDSDPIVKYSKEEFVKVFNTYLKYGGMEELVDIKNLDLHNENVLSKNDARVGNLVFNCINNKWQLTFAYLNYPIIEELNKKE
jgi:hypothetical protein